MIATSFVHFLYYDVQLTKKKKKVNKEKKLRSKRKSLNLGYRNGRIP